jgi:hypothetical protein
MVFILLSKVEVLGLIGWMVMDVGREEEDAIDAGSVVNRVICHPLISIPPQDISQ